MNVSFFILGNNLALPLREETTRTNAFNRRLLFIYLFIFVCLILLYLYIIVVLSPSPSFAFYYYFSSLPLFFLSSSKRTSRHPSFRFLIERFDEERNERKKEKNIKGKLILN